MKEDLENWNVHINAISKLSQKKLEIHVTKSLALIAKERSWSKLLKSADTSWRGQSYPKIINEMKFKTMEEKAIANKLVHLFFVTIAYFNYSIDKQKKIPESKYNLTLKRSARISRISKLLAELKKELHQEDIFLNYYTLYLEKNSILRSVESMKDFTDNENYLGFDSQEAIEYSFLEIPHLGPSRKFAKDADHLMRLLDPGFFEITHLSKFKPLNLSKLKFMVLNNLNYNFGGNNLSSKSQQTPWKFCSVYFEIFFTLQDLQEEFPTDFSPQNLQSKFRSAKK